MRSIDQGSPAKRNPWAPPSAPTLEVIVDYGDIWNHGPYPFGERYPVELLLDPEVINKEFGQPHRIIEMNVAGHKSLLSAFKYYTYNISIQSATNPPVTTLKSILKCNVNYVIYGELREDIFELVDDTVQNTRGRTNLTYDNVSHKIISEALIRNASYYNNLGARKFVYATLAGMITAMMGFPDNDICLFGALGAFAYGLSSFMHKNINHGTFIAMNNALPYSEIRFE